MSHLIGIFLALVAIAVSTCKAMPDIHKQMSPQQLQSIFHVDSPDAVPHYEVVQLLHHDTHEPATQQYSQNYRRRKRSVEPLQQDLKEFHDTNHVKKDLTKNPYYSELKAKSVKDLRSNSVYDAVKTTMHDKKIEDIKEHKVSLNAFGKNMNLTLKQTQGLFKDGQVHRLPMWYVDKEMNATHGLNLQKIEDELHHNSDNIGQVFQDEENMAAILMRRHEVTGELVMEGSIGHDMVIKPLPHDLAPNPNESHHVIFKREADMSEHLSDFAFMEPDDLATSEKLEKLQNRHKRSAHRTTLEDIELEEEFLEAEDGVEESEFTSHKRAKRQAPYIIYPEILVIVDYDGYRLHGGDNLQVKRYFISFWNGVDLRYRLLKGPRIRISIAGIIISRGRDATPYLERNRVGRDAIDSAAALTDMGKYLFRERRLPVYDIAVAITKYDMCRRRKGGRCTKGTAGFAYVGGACVVNKRLEKVNSVAIIEDTGGFSGIIVAAHEVGHLLGAVHDGSPPPSYLGGPGAQRCRWEDGYIMSDLRHTERGFRWSPCTVQSFHHFLNGDTATCLHNAPHEDSALGRSLPGTLLSLDAQCRRDRGTYACFKDERVCAQLFCFDAQTGYCVAYRPAAEGSSCGNGLHCLDGRCTPLPSNVIPNYGNHYRLGYNNSLQNAATTNNNGNNNGHDEPDNDNEDDDDEEDGDNEDKNNNNQNNGGGDDNDESNETIEKLKRKLSSLPLTTKTTLQLQQQQQQQQQHAPQAQQQKHLSTTTSAIPITSPYIVTSTPRYGSKSTFNSSTGRSSLVTPTFFENYFKKFQNHNQNSNSQQKPTTTAAVENKTKLKITTKTNDNKQFIQHKNNHKNDGNNDHEDDNDDGEEKSVNAFEAQFLKRTPVISSINEDDNDAYSSNSSGSLNTNNSYLNTNKFKTTTARNSNTNNNNNNNNNNESILLVTPPGLRSQTSLYVTNYIGDNTQQRLTTIRQQQQISPQQQQQQQPQNLSQDTKTTAILQAKSTPSPPTLTPQLTRSNQQQHQHESLYLISSTTRRPKIKTQKLIRRLRTQIK